MRPEFPVARVRRRVAGGDNFEPNWLLSSLSGDKRIEFGSLATF